MHLIDLTCPRCGAVLQVNPDVTRCTCQYCNNEMLIDNESAFAYDTAYRSELGRLNAQADFIRNQNEQLEHDRLKQQEEFIAQQNKLKKDFLRAKLCFIVSAIIFLLLGLLFSSFRLFLVLAVLYLIALIIDVYKTNDYHNMVAMLTSFVSYIPFMMFKSTNKLSSGLYGVFIGYTIGCVINYMG